MSRTPQNFVGLHAHDGFSTFDGLDYPQDHIDFVRENGMNALAITNHGHMNSFAHAYLHVHEQRVDAESFGYFFDISRTMVKDSLHSWGGEMCLIIGRWAISSFQTRLSS